MKIKRAVLAFTLMWPFIFVQNGLADILDHWHWRNPSPLTDSLRSVCFADGKFVAVGDGGVVFKSTDGINWDDGQRPVTQSLNKIIYAEGRFIVAGNNGVILVSTNGQDWVGRITGVTNNLLGIAFGNGKYVASGDKGRIMVSTDSITWNSNTVGTDNLNWVTFGNGVFVVPAPTVTNGSTMQLAVRVSSDGVNWTTALFPSQSAVAYASQLYDVEFANGTFLAATFVEDHPSPSSYTPALRFFSSADGTNWVAGGFSSYPFSPGSSDTPPFLNAINGLFYEFVGHAGNSGNFITTSTDGTTSTNAELTASSDGYPASEMAFGNGRFVLVGLAGKTWVSSEGTNWLVNYAGIKNPLTQLILGPSGYILAGHGKRVGQVVGGEEFYADLQLRRSLDGTGFSPIPGSPSDAFWAVEFDGTNYVALADLGRVYTSTNGSVWTQRTSNSDRTLKAVCRGATRWVAVGNAGRVITSPNTLAWTLRSSGTANPLSGVAFGNNVYVAVGKGGTIVTSTDAGANWDVQYSGTLATLVRVQFLNGQFYVVGDNGTILCSANGVDWQGLNSGITNLLNDIIFADGKYVICGSPGSLLQSTNGVDWQDKSTRVPTSAAFARIAFLDQSFWLVGAEGAILRSDSTDGIPRLTMNMSPTGFQLKIWLNVPPNFRVQSCTNLVLPAWQDAVCVTNAPSPCVWTDTNSPGNPTKFYRIVLP